MSQIHIEQFPVLGADFEDIESELFCSDREVTVGAFPALDPESREMVMHLAEGRPWAGR